MKIGCYHLPNNVILAPMAGVSDRPFREICIQKGAGLAVSEMVASNPTLLKNKKTLLKADVNGETGLRSVQIVGTEPLTMALAAQANVARGAQVIDINMGCPAKKVCAVAAGSALLKDEALVARILSAVVSAVDVPVTLKIRTGWDLQNRNALTIAKLAENCGIAALTVHGRTRACKFAGEAEYDTVKLIKQSVSIPVIANGDIDSPQKAKQVLDFTGTDGIMIGRAAQGNPWLFAQIVHFLDTGTELKAPRFTEIFETLVSHLDALYRFYGDRGGVRIARKHIAWYLKHLPVTVSQESKIIINQAETPSEQVALVHAVFDCL